MNPVLFSSASVEWETPQDLFDKLDAEFHFTLDVCATRKNAKCKTFIAKNSLDHDWSNDICWMNPPYGRVIGDWVAKAAATMEEGGRVVALLPARTDTRWWHNHIWNERGPRYGVQVRFLKGRLKFGGSKNSAPFPSCVVVFG